MSHRLRLPLILTALLPALVIPCEAPATPAFSRQIHADCRSCHFQNMRSLNRYGREFKRNGFHETEKMRDRRLQRQQQKARHGGPDR